MKNTSASAKKTGGSVFGRLDSPGALNDALALLIGAGIFFYCLYFVRYSVLSSDDGFYWTIPLRILNGDALITDEWHLTQFSAVFQILPVKLFLALTGSTEGIILFMRQLYCVVKLAVFFVLYAYFRRYGIWGVLGASAFTTYDLFGITTLNYYNMAAMAAAVCTCILFIGKKPGKLRLGAAGFIFACCVINEPSVSLLYFIYAAVFFVFLIKNKNVGTQYPFLLSPADFISVTSGVAVCAAGFLAMLIGISGFPDFIKYIPELFTDSVHGSNLFFGEESMSVRLADLLSSLSIPVCAASAAVFIAVLIGRKKGKIGYAAAFTAVSVSFIVSVAVMAVKAVTAAPADYLLYLPLFFAFYGPACMLLAPKKDKRLLRFWLAGLAFSFAADFFSNCLIAGGLQLLCLATVPMFGSSLKHLRATGKDAPADIAKTKKKNRGIPRKAAAVIAAAALFIAAGSESARFILRGQWFVVENFHSRFRKEETDTGKASFEKIDEGPYKGIRTTPLIKERYLGMLRDLEAMKTISDGPVYICGDASWAYLYLNRPMSAYSTYFIQADAFTRNMRWWELHPGKKPSIIYLQKLSVETYAFSEKFVEDNLDKFASVIENAGIKETDFGYIIFSG